jgi:hypothetical protein
VTKGKKRRYFPFVVHHPDNSSSVSTRVKIEASRSVHEPRRSGRLGCKTTNGKVAERQLELIARPAFEISDDVRKEVKRLSESGNESRGAIFTRKEVVEFILDLVGYTIDQPLHKLRMLEPSFGEGSFLFPIVDRLLCSFRKSKSSNAFNALKNALCAIEIHQESFNSTRAKVILKLREESFTAAEATDLTDAWVRNGDFLLESLEPGFHFVVGNPPYMRQELISDILIAEYRRRYATIYDRADIYVPFIERSLSLLLPNAGLGFICADRWMKNRYGGPLRKMIADGYRLKFYIDMVDTDAFHSDVMAYPAITIISREQGGSTRIAHKPRIDATGLRQLSRSLTANREELGPNIKEMDGVVAGAEPWILESSDQTAVLRRLEKAFPTLEEAGCKVGIGVATGADSVFIDRMEKLDVEESRKLPLAMTTDIQSGIVKWRGYGVLNPFEADGKLVKLENYPKFAAYLKAHGEKLRARHVSKRNPEGWYRTIDRITPSLAKVPKLLIPDIKGSAHVVYEAGELYPHHNLYFITSSDWDLKALRALLMSGIARLFVSAYSTKMHGGFLRFQAQYLRRIRIPQWNEVPLALRRILVDAAEKGDVSACDSAAFKVYGLSKSEREALGGNGV